MLKTSTLEIYILLPNFYLKVTVIINLENRSENSTKNTELLLKYGAISLYEFIVYETCHYHLSYMTPAPQILRFFFFNKILSEPFSGRSLVKPGRKQKKRKKNAPPKKRNIREYKARFYK